MGKQLRGDDSFIIKMGAQLDDREVVSQINNLRDTVEKKKPIQFTIDGKKFQKEIEVIKTKYGELIELTQIKAFKNGWHGTYEVIQSDVSKIVTLQDIANKGAKEFEQNQKRSAQETQKATQEQVRELEKRNQTLENYSSKIANQLAKEQESNAVLKEQLKTEKTLAKEREKNLNKQVNALEKQVKAEQKATEQAQKHYEKQKKLNEETKKGNSIFRNFTDTFLKMVKFNTINLIYDGLIDSMRQAVEITKEFNTATTELRKVSDLEGDALKEYTQELAEYGETVGRTVTDMVNSATIFKRTGATDEEAKKLAVISEAYRNVADSEITSAEASSFLVSQMKAFNITADESIHVIDAVNEVANHYATSTDDLQTALSKSAAAMATAGNSYEETIALTDNLLGQLKQL